MEDNFSTEEEGDGSGSNVSMGSDGELQIKMKLYSFTGHSPPAQQPFSEQGVADPCLKRFHYTLWFNNQKLKILVIVNFTSRRQLCFLLERSIVLEMKLFITML